jgi:NADH/NAD ratio-sensing transcriptional regulator Rex
MQLHHATSISPQLRAAIVEALAAIDKRAEVDRAVLHNQEALNSAAVGLAEIEAAAASLDAAAAQAEAAASMDPAKKAEVGKAIKAADKAAVELAEKQREIQRREAARNILIESAREADQTISAVKSSWPTAIAEFRGQLLEAFAEDLREACAPLIPVVQAARAIHAALPYGFCEDLLKNIAVFDPRTVRTGDRYAQVRITGIDFLADSEAIASAPTDFQLALREIAEVSKALQTHKPFVVQPLPTAKTPYVVKGSSVTEQKRRAEARATETEWTPAPSVWTAESWGISNGKRGDVRSS